MTRQYEVIMKYINVFISSPVQLQETFQDDIPNNQQGSTDDTVKPNKKQRTTSMQILPKAKTGTQKGSLQLIEFSLV